MLGLSSATRFPCTHWVGRVGGLRNASAKSHAELEHPPEIDIGGIAWFADEHVKLLPSLPNLQLIGGCYATCRDLFTLPELTRVESLPVNVRHGVRTFRALRDGRARRQACLKDRMVKV
jgi:hypothetical protein